MVLDHHDGTLLPTLEVRLQVIQIMREYKPNLVISLRPWDYHPDHRYTGVVVQDAINMVIVGNLLPYAPRAALHPGHGLHLGPFPETLPFYSGYPGRRGRVYEQKMDALHCHTSQMYEWLDHPQTSDPAERRLWLKKKLETEMTTPATLYRQKLIEVYGKEKGGRCITSKRSRCANTAAS